MLYDFSFIASFVKEAFIQHVGGGEGGGHTVKIIGWGEENNVPYWLVANSWSIDFGENGHFRIARGYNECGIESRVIAGMMKV
ncbi:hypothetical protein OESDEN_10460 [Oesophagostomum dentatum]|uniref:Peptidase C1A papain C-terminal domain-containing protein n=1 Tax=Oesophagostomum dentatum TaxID=61180 RepID=A0A0B1SWQ8_OESDE|nr:hypothetical protein OESDEN_10460 [Oesophagostomum dentatum]